MDAYAYAIADITDERQVAGNLAVALFGTKVLLKMTVSSKGSNRNNQTRKSELRLDPIKVLAIKGLVPQHYCNEFD